MLLGYGGTEVLSCTENMKRFEKVKQSRYRPGVAQRVPGS
jgi:hypothetical protein